MRNVNIMSIIRSSAVGNRLTYSVPKRKGRTCSKLLNLPETSTNSKPVAPRTAEHREVDSDQLLIAMQQAIRQLAAGMTALSPGSASDLARLVSVANGAMACEVSAWSGM